jgi:Emfourin
MRRLITAVLAAAVLALTGCGSDRPASIEVPHPTQTSRPPASVDSVAMTQSGGFAGLRRTWEVGPSDPGHAAVFAAASQQALADAEGSTGKAPCCDLFQYRLTVSYSDGGSESFRFYDGAPTDPALTRLAHAVLRTQPQPSDSPTLQ